MKFSLRTNPFSTSTSENSVQAGTPEQTSAGEIAFQVAVLGVLSLAVYLLAFVRPYNLFQWGNLPGESIAKMTGQDQRAAVAYVIAFGLLFALYWFTARRVLGQSSRTLWAVVIGGAVAFSAVMLFLYPIDALDIFDYIIRGRMQVLHGGNPFYQTPHVFSADPLYSFTGWKDATTAYGPGWEMLAAVITRFTGNNIVVNILAFKAVELLAYGGTIGVIAALLKRFAPERALFGVLLFAWNPLVVYVTAGNGHNDALMVFFVVLGFYFVARERFTLAALMMVAGALVKFIPALLFPLVLLAGLKRLRTWPQRLSFLLITGGASLILTLAFFLPYYQGGDFLGMKWRGTMFTTSLPTWAVILLEQNLHLGALFADFLVSRAALILLVAWIVRELLMLWRSQNGAQAPLDWQPYVTAGLRILLFYLLVTCLWFQPWYVIWGVALAALLPESGLTRATIFFSMMSNWKMVIFDYYIVHGAPLPPFVRREWPLTALTLGPTWAFFIYEARRVQSLPRRLVQRLRGAPAPAAATLVAERERE